MSLCQEDSGGHPVLNTQIWSAKMSQNPVRRSFSEFDEKEKKHVSHVMGEVPDRLKGSWFFSEVNLLAERTPEECRSYIENYKPTPYKERFFP